MSDEPENPEEKPSAQAPQFFVNGMAVAGAKDLEDAKRIYEETQNITGP